MKNAKGEIMGIVAGEKKSFSFLPPYDVKLSNKTIYTVGKITTINNLIREGVDVYSTIYTANGMSNTEYVDDISNGIMIVKLILGNNDYYIPENKIVVSSDSTVSYVRKLIGINLGYIPVDEDISPLLEDILELVKARTGIAESIIDSKDVTSEIILTETEHIVRELIRDGVRTDNNNYYSKFMIVSEQLNLATDKLRAIETAEINTRL